GYRLQGTGYSHRYARWAAAALVLAVTACDARPDDESASTVPPVVRDTIVAPGGRVGAPTAEREFPYVSPRPPWKPEVRRARERLRAEPGLVWEMNGLRYTFYESHVRIDTLDREAARAAPSTRVDIAGGSYYQIWDVRYRFVNGELVRDTVSQSLEREALRRADAPFWRKSREWNGTGYHTTESFAVRARVWRVIYGAREAGEGGWQKISVYDERGRRTLGRIHEGAGLDTMIAVGPGIFHLDVGSAKSRWHITVEERTRPAEAVPDP
ncbi:MAG TPA: hypothetical protein VFQ39_18630, partial [Longimicrobium sp.]|nr:hypothetical protein [Longimicrobium sp.]